MNYETSMGRRISENTIQLSLIGRDSFKKSKKLKIYKAVKDAFAVPDIPNGKNNFR